MVDIGHAEFMKSAADPSGYPETALPEVAFAGRSNVGKSSLINTLINRKRLVRTSSTPGRTQLINFFEINRKLIFCDLPGYGYAKVPAHIQKKWGPMVETYLLKRANLKGVVLLVDIRRNPGTEEMDLMHWLAINQLPVILVATKADKLSRSAQNQAMAKLAEAFRKDRNAIQRFSAKTRVGRNELWKQIFELIS